MVSSNVRTLIKRDKGVCHYCKRHVDINQKKKYPTRDHIVPRSLGGPNRLDNYVLACSHCNNDRGTSLFYCDCRDCREIILDFLYNPDSLKMVFDGIISHNRPIVSKQHEISSHFYGKWGVRFGYNKRYFETYEAAIEFALSHEFTKEVHYG